MNAVPLLRRYSLALLACAAAGLTSCSSTKSTGHRTSDTFDPPAIRPSNIAATRVKVSTGAQRVYVVEGGKVLLATPCSVGTPGAPTPRGSFTIYHKDATRRRQSEPDRGYPMAYWMEFKSAYGLHWGFVKPYPCTHGCIRLPMKSAAKIFAMTRTGTPIEIAASQPEDATEGAKLPILDDGPLPNPSGSYLRSPQFFEDAKYKGNMFQ